MPDPAVVSMLVRAVLDATKWPLLLPVLPVVADFGEDASSFMMAFSAAFVVASKLFDVVTSDTWQGSRLICCWSEISGKEKRNE
ncbi:Kup system potassium uptake protein [Anopheles sinensis]|uniref:Kup system potassium uptake protein n=1 Tax=Anopheles sinensis TaxID=74873 RepID=A0A084VGM8_ANOSI|nr:Kup system potassium uptake protein [Anopheles sinensis]